MIKINLVVKSDDFTKVLAISNEVQDRFVRVNNQQLTRYIDMWHISFYAFNVRDDFTKEELEIIDNSSAYDKGSDYGNILALLDEKYQVPMVLDYVALIDNEYCGARMCNDSAYVDELTTYSAFGQKSYENITTSICKGCGTACLLPDMKVENSKIYCRYCYDWKK